jgi:hypothetical protein
MASGRRTDNDGNKHAKEELKGKIFTLNGLSYYGIYRGDTRVCQTTGKKIPTGFGDYDADGTSPSMKGYAYSGDWRDGKPCGIGWWRYGEGDIYAGDVDGDHIRHGHGTYWSEDGQMCFAGDWSAGYPQGEGTMLRSNGELWRVHFDGTTWLWRESTWDRPKMVSLLGRVIEGGPAPVARREDRGAASEWRAIVETDGRQEQWILRGLTKVLGTV